MLFLRRQSRQLYKRKHIYNGDTDDRFSLETGRQESPNPQVPCGMCILSSCGWNGRSKEQRLMLSAWKSVKSTAWQSVQTVVTSSDMLITTKAWRQFPQDWGPYNNAKHSSRICWLQIWINRVGKTGSRLRLDWHSSAGRLTCSVSHSCPWWCVAQESGWEAGGVRPTPRLYCCIPIRTSSDRFPISYLHYFCWLLLLAVLRPSSSPILYPAIPSTPFHIRPVYPLPPPRFPF